jgi:hypothetical protein
MESMLVIFGAGVLAFGGALVALLRVRTTCAGTCERLGRPACEGCPRVARAAEPTEEKPDAAHS